MIEMELEGMLKRCRAAEANAAALIKPLIKEAMAAFIFVAADADIDKLAAKLAARMKRAALLKEPHQSFVDGFSRELSDVVAAAVWNLSENLPEVETRVESSRRHG